MTFRYLITNPMKGASCFAYRSVDQNRLDVCFHLLLGNRYIGLLLRLL